MGHSWLHAAVLLAACLPSVVLGNVFSLSDLNWTLKNANGSIAIPGSVPSQAHLDLLRAGIITEPLLGINGALVRLVASREADSQSYLEFTQRWIVNDNWTYTADLTPFLTQISEGSNKGGDDKTLLVFYGIDTVANIVSREYFT